MLKILKIDPATEVIGLEGQSNFQSIVTFAEYGRAGLSTMNEQYKIADEIFGRHTSSLSDSENGIPRTHRMPIVLVDGRLTMNTKDGEVELKEGDEIPGHLNRVLTPTPEFAQQLPRIHKGKKVYVQILLALKEEQDVIKGKWADFEDPSEQEQEAAITRTRQRPSIVANPFVAY